MLTLLYGGAIFLGAFFVVSGTAHYRQDDFALVRSFSGGVDDLSFVFPIGAAVGLFLRALHDEISDVRMQGVVHLTLVAFSLAVLPIAPSVRWKPTGSEDPTYLILSMLAFSIGLPYFLLSTTGPLVQAWFARERPGSVPYRLFALSNLGSMLALLSYPILIEPWLPVHLRSINWSFAYVAFVLIYGALAWRGMRAGESAQQLHNAASNESFGPGQLILSAALAACSSILMMAVTRHLTQNVAPIPPLSDLRVKPRRSGRGSIYTILR